MKEIKYDRTDGEIYHALVLEGSILWKWLYYPKQSTDSMQSLSNYNIFHRTRKENFTVCMETEKTLNSQCNLENEKWSWRDQIPWCQITLQSYSHQIALFCTGTKQKCTAMEQDRKSRDKSMHLWSPNLW